jgi:hypothetical protein
MDMPMTDIVNAELVTHTGPLSPDQARAAQRTYQEISSALIDHDTDIQVIQTRKGPREFPKRSAFQKLANAYRVSTEIVSRELTYDDDAQLIRCDAIVRATHPDGRYAEGDGACSRSEDRFARGADKIDHDLPATAVTRATNRAISNLVAFGAVSAEEVTATGVADEGSGVPPPGASLPAWAKLLPDGEIRDFGNRLQDILAAANAPDTPKHVGEIGEAIWQRCDGIPRAADLTVQLIADALTSGPADARSAASDATSEDMP